MALAASTNSFRWQSVPPLGIVPQSELSSLPGVAASLELQGWSFTLCDQVRLGQAGVYPGKDSLSQGPSLPAHPAPTLCFLGDKFLWDSNLFYSLAIFFPALYICPSSTANIRFKA